ncbi:MAG: hypothetical protein U1E15_07785 [Hyphomicrobiales bacterium]
MKLGLVTAVCAAFCIAVLSAQADAAALAKGNAKPNAKPNAKCQAWARKKAERKLGPKYMENAIVVGATGGLAGKPVDGKKTFTGFGLGGAALGAIVAGEKRAKLVKQYYAACAGGKK